MREIENVADNLLVVGLAVEESVRVLLEALVVYAYLQTDQREDLTSFARRYKTMLATVKNQ